MGLHKLTAGDGYTYLTRQVAALDSTERRRTGLGDYYDQKGEAPGRWLGAGLPGLGIEEGEVVSEEQMVALFGHGRHPNGEGGLGRRFNLYPSAESSFRREVAHAFAAYNTERGLSTTAPIPVEERAWIRTTVATRLHTEQHDRPPVDARELSGFVARASRPATSAVAGYDLTFSPVKSVSTLWALAGPEVAARIEQAHHAAVADTIAWLEREAVFTRVGSGARQVEVRGLVAAAFTHRDSRTGDPDLHTHVAITNKVQTLDTPDASGNGGGRWLAIDGRVLFKANVAASERYNTRLEAELVDRLGVRFVDRDTVRRGGPGPGTGRRPVREIAGVDPVLARWWSSRRKAIEVRRTGLAAAFQTAHGRTPTPVEAIGLAQQATLETRNPKHEPRREADQRTAWRRQASEVLGGDNEVETMLADALTPDNTPPTRNHATELTEGWVAGTAERVVTALEASRATWQTWHVRAEAERQARNAGIGLHDLDTAVDRVVDHTLESASVRLGTPDPVTEPASLRRADGVSVYQVHGSTRYTSARVLAAEQQLLATAKTGGGPAVGDVGVGIAIAEAAANGTTLNAAQAAMVRELATSGARLQLALAPAGTGKTTTMAVLGRAWAGADGYLLGLAPSAQAAKELGNAIDGHTDTLAKLTWTLTHAPREQWPAWVERIGPRTLVVIDEAGAAGTTELAAVVEFVTGRGGSVRLVGDDQQLASVAAGGILRDLARQVGPTAAVTLTEVRRFANPAEAAASLAVRHGDPCALGFYADRSRIHVGDPGTAAEHAYTAWAADRASGLDSILLAGTRDLVTGLNQRARTDRLAHLTTGLTTRLTTGLIGPGRSDVNAQVTSGAEVALADGTRASVGDPIVTRRNERRLVVSGSDWVKNGDRWTIEQVHADGSVQARHHTHRLCVMLPAAYVAEHVQLGYATTVHAAQGITVDTAHTVVTGDQTRQVLYVALSRGRTANHLYLADTCDGDPHDLTRPETLDPPTAIDVLTRILARDGTQSSATTTRRDLDAPVGLLAEAVTRYHDALGYAAEQTLGAGTPGAGTLSALDRQVEVLWPGLTGEPAWSTLRGHLALHALDGADPLDALADAAAPGGLATAHDRAAVLDWRIASTGPAGDGPLPWLPAVPATLAQNPDWGGYLDARATRIRGLADQVRGDATGWARDDTPEWARHLTGPEHAGLRGDLAVWRAAVGVPDTDQHPTGPQQPAADTGRHQASLDRRTRAASRTREADLGQRTWDRHLPHHVSADPQASRLRGLLDALDGTGLDVTAALGAALHQARPLPGDLPADALWWRIVEHIGPAAADPTAPSTPTRDPDRTEADPTPSCRWQSLLEEHHPAITRDPGWVDLAETLRRAHAEGFDITANIVGLATQQPLTGVHAATDLRYRLIDASQLTATSDSPPPLPPPSPAITRSTIEHQRHGLGRIPGGPAARGPAPPGR